MCFVVSLQIVGAATFLTFCASVLCCLCAHVLIASKRNTRGLHGSADSRMSGLEGCCAQSFFFFPRLPLLPHTTLCRDGWMNWGLMKEKPANSLWSMLEITSWSGGVSTGWVRVKNLSKFSAALPHWKRWQEQRGLFWSPNQKEL